MSNEIMNIVVPMAGMGSRFAVAGYSDPKPLISIHGTPMIRLVIENIKPKSPHRFIFICQESHVAEYDLRRRLMSWAPGCEIIELKSPTEGAACTVLTARSFIDNPSPLLIANSDQYVDASIDDFLRTSTSKNLDGLIMTMRASDPKWSFVGLDKDEFAQRVVEKEAISDCATVGIYHFNHGSTYVKAAEAMIAKNIRVNNEFYVAPVYNEMIGCNARIGIHDIGSEFNGMYGLGTPADLEKFLTLPISIKAVQEANNDCR